MPNQLFGLAYKPIQLAQQGGIITTLEGYQPANLIKDGIAWAIIAASVLCIVFIFVGGISFILSGGQDEKIQKAVATIRYAIIGLIIVFLSVSLVNLVTFIFDVPFDFVDYREILEKVKILSNQLFQQSSTSPSDFQGF